MDIKNQYWFQAWLRHSWSRKEKIEQKLGTTNTRPPYEQEIGGSD